MKSFILYTEISKPLQMLTSEQKGRLFQAILDYAQDGIVTDDKDQVVNVMFAMIKCDIDRNAEKWEEIRRKRSEAGKLGGRPAKKEKTQEKPKTEEKPAKEKEPKRKYGEYAHVLLTDKEYTALCEEYGDIETGRAIVYLDEYIERKGYKAKSHYLCIRKWVFDAMKEDEQKKAKISNFEKKGTFDDIFKEMGQL